MTLLQQVEAAWKEAGLDVSLPSEKLARIRARVDRSQRERAFAVALRTLDQAGCRTCGERDSDVWSIYAFSESGSICLDLSDGATRRRRAFLGCDTPRIALLGPDGV